MTSSSSSSQIVANLRATWGALTSLAGSLTPQQWSTQSLCPAWTAQGVVVHAASIEQVLAGWRPGGDAPFAAIGGAHAELSALDPGALTERFSSIVDQRLAQLDAMSEEEFATVGATPVGPGTYARFMSVRVFDNWVHERDIRVPLGISADDGGPAAEMSLDEVHQSLGYIAGKKIGLADGKGITFRLTGPVERSMSVKVDGRASVVASLDAPDAVVTTDSLTFMLLACGRIDPQGPISDGRISWTGDAEIGERAARNLRFTM